MVDFVQPNSDLAVLKGYKFFRLNTLLSSPGDIFESKQSGHAFAIGPDSDIANVGVAYYDEQVDTFVNQAVITPNRPWLGRLDARNEQVYMPAQRPGRLLFWSNDLYDPAYTPTGVGVGDVVVNVPPRLDVIEYFTPQSSPPPTRPDRTFFYQELPLPANDLYLLIPYYGRKSASIRIINQTAGDLTYTIYGVNYFANDNSPHSALETPIVGTIGAPTTIATGAQIFKLITERVDGMFDTLMLVLHAVTPGPPTPVQIITSDTPV